MTRVCPVPVPAMHDDIMGPRVLVLRSLTIIWRLLDFNFGLRADTDFADRP